MKELFTTSFLFLIMVIFGYSQAELGMLPEETSSSMTNRSFGLPEYYSVTGKYYLSVDGAGSGEFSTYTVYVDKPNSAATVHKAFVVLAPLPYETASGLSLEGIPVTWDNSAPTPSGGLNYISDVTSIVAPVVNASSPGLVPITVTENVTDDQDGIALLVIFNDDSRDVETIVILFGSLDDSGDNFSISLVENINPADPGAFLHMGLGIGFSLQSGTVYQSTTIQLNGQRLTSSAGGNDDHIGVKAPGWLVTVGGIGDDPANPPDPFAQPEDDYYDDELYDLLPFITGSTVDLNFETSAVGQENAFLAYFEYGTEETAIPISNWAIYLGIFLIVALGYIRFRRLF
jgi:hypothetical protein